jgi:hypothetical protein
MKNLLFAAAAACMFERGDIRRYMSARGTPIGGGTETKVSKSPDIMADFPAYTESADGAIGIKNGRVYITKGSACALTLALPTAGDDDGKVLEVTDTTGFAHTVTTPSNGINGSKHIATFAGGIGQKLRLEAYNGGWYCVMSPPTGGVTIS